LLYEYVDTPKREEIARLDRKYFMLPDGKLCFSSGIAMMNQIIINTRISLNSLNKGKYRVPGKPAIP